MAPFPQCSEALLGPLQSEPLTRFSWHPSLRVLIPSLRPFPPDFYLPPFRAAAPSLCSYFRAPTLGFNLEVILNILEPLLVLFTRASDLSLVLTLGTIPLGFPPLLSSLLQGYKYFIVYFKDPTISVNFSWCSFRRTPTFLVPFLGPLLGSFFSTLHLWEPHLQGPNLLLAPFLQYPQNILVPHSRLYAFLDTPPFFFYSNPLGDLS